jgi:hypothetical protein
VYACGLQRGTLGGQGVSVTHQSAAWLAPPAGTITSCLTGNSKKGQEEVQMVTHTQLLIRYSTYVRRNTCTGISPRRIFFL